MQWRDQVCDNDRLAVRQLVTATGFFSPAEQDIAVELVDDALIQGEAVSSVQGEPGLTLNADGTRRRIRPRQFTGREKGGCDSLLSSTGTMIRDPPSSRKREQK